MGPERNPCPSLGFPGIRVLRNRPPWRRKVSSVEGGPVLVAKLEFNAHKPAAPIADAVDGAILWKQS
jgi:hypothetical protein